MKVKDNVNHPSHYTEGKIECIDYIQDKLTEEEFRGYIKGNVLKYITRERHKNGNEDLRKAKWYLDRLVDGLEEEKAVLKADAMKKHNISDYIRWLIDKQRKEDEGK